MMNDIPCSERCKCFGRGSMLIDNRVVHRQEDIAQNSILFGEILRYNGTVDGI